jgi:hypothetical protein
MPLNLVTYNAPPAVSLVPGTTVTQYADHTGSSLYSDLHGKWYNAAKNGLVFHANVTAQTLPVVASGLVSKFSIYNQAGSGKNLELISCDIGFVSATTVVDVVGLYYEQSAALNPTSITFGTAVGGLIGNSTTPVGKFATALTHTSGITPTRLMIISTFGAVTSTADNPVHYDFDGKVIIPPSTIISIAMSTAASTATAVDVGLSWCEWPI